MRRTLILAGCGAVALTSWAAAAEAPITLAVRAIQPKGAVVTHVFSGRISSGAAGELVTVLAKVCPRDFETAVAGGHTLAGGLWELSAASPRTAATYRARWEGHFSESVTFWSPILVNAAKAGRGSVVVFVDTAPALQNLNRKFVELQRFDGARGVWRPYRRARLKRNTSPGLFPFNFTTTFTRVGRGLTVRVLVPRKTAAPCYLARATGSIRT